MTSYTSGLASVNIGDSVTIVRWCIVIVLSGWWMCSVDGGRVGWAPPSYLKKCDKATDSDDEYLGILEKCKLSMSSCIAESYGWWSTSIIMSLKVAHYIKRKVWRGQGLAPYYPLADQNLSPSTSSSSFPSTSYINFPFLLPLPLPFLFTVPLFLSLNGDFLFITDSSSKDKDSDDSGLDDHEAEMSGSRSVSRNTFKVPKIDVEEYRAIDSYEADGAGQISLQEGCTIHVLDKMEDGKLSCNLCCHFCAYF